MKIEEVRRNAFYQFPKWLDDEPYCKMSDRAKLTYMRLWDRRKLSLKNKWYDENDDVFVYFTNKEFMKVLNCSKPAIISAKKELSDFGLLREIRQGVNMPNRLYISGSKKSLLQEVKNIDHGSKKNLLQEVKNIDHGSKKNLLQEVKNIDTIKTDNINTNLTRLIEPDDDVGAGTLYSNSTIGRALRENGIRVNHRHHQELLEYVGRENMSFDMIVRAIEITSDSKEPSFKYLRGILENWRKQGFTSLAQVEEHERQRKQPKQEEYDGIGNIPEWSSMHPKNANKPKKESRYNSKEWQKWLEEKKNGQ